MVVAGGRSALIALDMPFGPFEMLFKATRHFVRAFRLLSKLW
jgi:hypothetical protein